MEEETKIESIPGGAAISIPKLPDRCPFCDAGVIVMQNGKPCQSTEGLWVVFQCLTSIHSGQDQRKIQSRPCEAAERARIATEVGTLRTANAALVERMTSAHQELRRYQDMVERAEERVRRLEEQLATLGHERAASMDAAFHAEDLAVDDEINRRRERRHFEPDHFGT